MTIIEQLEKRKKLLAYLNSPSNEEIFTPVKLVEEMLDKLPKEIWTDPNLLWCDPCAKSGVFMLEVVLRLMKNIAIENETERYKHIINNMVKAYVNVERNKWLVSKMVYGSKDSVEKVGLIEDINKIKIEEMPKFDVVVGNPPYQNGKDKMFYMKFVKISYDISKHYVLMITPKAIFTSNNNFYKTYKNKFNYINLSDKIGTYFKVASSFTYYIIDKFKNNFNVNVQFSNINMNIDLNKLQHNILDKRNYDNTFNSIMNKCYLNGTIERKNGCGDLINESEDKRHIFAKKESDIYKYAAYLSSKEDRKNVFSQKPAEGYGIEKLIVSSIIEPKRAERFSEINKNKGVGRYSAYYPVKNKDNAKNIQQFFNLDFYKFLDKNKRYGRYAFLDIPKLDFSRSWTDQELYEYFNLTQEEIDYIESQIK